jgi:hypothetical protein
MSPLLLLLLLLRAHTHTHAPRYSRRKHPLKTVYDTTNQKDIKSNWKWFRLHCSRWEGP